MSLAGPVDAAAAEGVAPGTVIEGRMRVLDGDTLTRDGIRIRLSGVDAPEKDQVCVAPDGMSWPCGRLATQALEARIGRDPVRCQVVESDIYDRLVATCWAGRENINAWLVEAGHALVYRNRPEGGSFFVKPALRIPDPTYLEGERRARTAGLGLWSGGFTVPFDYRNGVTDLTGSEIGAPAVGVAAPGSVSSGTPRVPEASTRAGAERAKVAACRIKGNVSSEGARIYHMPGGAYYEKTRIDPDQGERWFCTEDEARSAGWTRAAK